MKILHISTFDTCGGAAIAAYRLHEGLLQAGADSRMLVAKKLSDDDTVIGSRSLLSVGKMRMRAELDKLPLALYPGRRREIFSAQWVPGGIGRMVARIDPDVVNLHWICNGYIPIQGLREIKRPIVWTLHDMWPFTGGCHFSMCDEAYTGSCGSCPALDSRKDRDLSRRVWERKKKAWERVDIVPVSPSRWLAKRAEASSLLKGRDIRCIAHGLDTVRYSPRARTEARGRLGLSRRAKIVLFGAISSNLDTRKGAGMLPQALNLINKNRIEGEIEAVIWGWRQSDSPPPDFGCGTRRLGHVREDMLIDLYSAADVLVIPSREEAFGQVAAEALSCGTPVATFDTTGLKDVVDHKENGYRARCFDPADLAEGIMWLLEDDERRRELSKNARQKAVKKYDLLEQAREYKKLYKDIIERR